MRESEKNKPQKRARKDSPYKVIIEEYEIIMNINGESQY